MMHGMKKAGIKGNYVPTQNLHLTMAFIGEMTSAEPVKEALQNIKIKPLERFALTVLA